MLHDQETTKCLKVLFDSLERAIRERHVLLAMLQQHGIENVEDQVRKNMEQPEVRAALDDELREVEGLRLKVLRVLEGGSQEDQKLRQPTGETG
jgi:hypothetical protein